MSILVENREFKLNRVKYMKMRYRILLMIMSAVLVILSFPLYDHGWIIWFALVPGLIAVQNLNFWKNLALGYIFGFLFMYFTLTWFGFFGWEPHIVGSIYFATFFAVFFGLSGRCTRFFKPGTSWLRILIPAMLWVGLEWFKAQGLMAFSWGFFGFTQYRFIPLIQISAITGVFGVSFLIVLLNTILAEILLVLGLESATAEGEKEKKPLFQRIISSFGKVIDEDEKYRVLRHATAGFLVMFSFIILIGILVVPVGSYKDIGTRMGLQKLSVGSVQPNVMQEEKWKPETLEPSLELLKDETSKLAVSGADLVVWPETAVNHRDPLNTPHLRRFIKDTARKSGVNLATGLIERMEDRKYNSSVLVDSSGEIIDRYRKIHLVPMAEYLPWSDVLGKYQIFNRSDNYNIGELLTVFDTGKGKFSILICFESYFDYLARRLVNRGAEFLVVMTNDAWYLDTNEAKCHFIMAIFRAVENRRWIVHSANTGVSGIIDPWGRVPIETELFTATSFLGEIYPMKTKTIYTRLGNWFPVLCLIGSILLMFVYCPTGKTKKTGKTGKTEDKKIIGEGKTAANSDEG
jgi:apolipoprotein N-acyltransferase